MFCINCGSSNVTNIFAENYICSKCGDTNIVEYYSCAACNIIWKAIDGELVDKKLFFLSALSPETAKICKLMSDNTEGRSMSEIIHRCLHCNTVSYEKEERVWHCPECGFEWEVIDNL